MEGEGERVRGCSDPVLCLHMCHLLGIGVRDGHHKVAYTHSGLSGLASRGQLQERSKVKHSGETIAARNLVTAPQLT